MSGVRRWLVIAASLFAVGELIDGVYQVPAGIVFALVLGLCAWWPSQSFREWIWPGRSPAGAEPNITSDHSKAH